jgi:hypothetical protein
MSSDSKRPEADEGHAIDDKVQRVVGISALRRIHALIAERERENRLLRAWVVPAAIAASLVLAALIWILLNPWSGAAPESRPTGNPPPVGAK